MPLTTNLFCYLWDLEDEGIDYVLDVIQGELGAQGITVPVSHPPIDQLRPHDNASPRRFRSAGGLQFQPDLSRYQSTRARPVVADWLKKRNPFEKLAEACHTRGLELHAWLIARYNPALIAANPSLAIRDVFGETSPDTLCLVNPDVQEYLRAVVDELSRGYGCQGIVFDTRGMANRFHLDEILNLPREYFTSCIPWMQLCFCESCRQQTRTDSIDITTAERRARLEIERVLQEEDAATANVHPGRSEQDPIGALSVWQERQSGILELSLRTICHSQCMFSVSTPGATHILPSLPNRLHDGICYGPAPSEESLLTTAIKEIAKFYGSSNHTWLMTDVAAPCFSDAASLVRHMGHIAELGVAGVHIFNYGMLSQKRLGWVKQAIRYARRTG